MVAPPARAIERDMHYLELATPLLKDNISCEYISCVCSFNKSAIIKLATQSKIIASFTFHNNIKSYIFNTPSTRSDALDRQSSQENTLQKL